MQFPLYSFSDWYSRLFEIISSVFCCTGCTVIGRATRDGVVQTKFIGSIELQDVWFEKGVTLIMTKKDDSWVNFQDHVYWMIKDKLMILRFIVEIIKETNFSRSCIRYLVWYRSFLYRLMSPCYPLFISWNVTDRFCNDFWWPSVHHF